MVDSLPSIFCNIGDPFCSPSSSFHMFFCRRNVRGSGQTGRDTSRRNYGRILNEYRTARGIVPYRRLVHKPR